MFISLISFLSSHKATQKSRKSQKNNFVYGFSALSALDFSMRSEQIDMIREWLSPAKTSDANFRIECTVVRDLLDSEIEYVSSLRNVVQVCQLQIRRPTLKPSL